MSATHDHAHGVMVQDRSGAGRFESVTLRPRVTVTAGSDVRLAERLHADVPGVCFIARSVNFPVRYEPSVVEDAAEDAARVWSPRQ